MKLLVVLSALVAVCVANEINAFVPTFYAGSYPAVSQYHSQDALGQYSYGYAGGPSAKTETRTFDGVTRGAYSYIDANSKLQTVEYVADPLNGFRAAATNLPKAPEFKPELPVAVRETPEVERARIAHLEAVKEAELRTTVVDESRDSIKVEAPVEEKRMEPMAEEKKLVEVEAKAVPAFRLAFPALPEAPVVGRYVEPFVHAPFVRTIATPHAIAYNGFDTLAFRKPLLIEQPLLKTLAIQDPRTYFAKSLPIVKGETPEVARARAEHLLEVEATKLRNLAL